MTSTTAARRCEVRATFVSRTTPALQRHGPLDSFELLGLSMPAAYMARHSRSFRFASFWMPVNERQLLARVYAWCRFTDDLVDRSRHDERTTRRRLDAWLAASRLAYAGHESGIGLVDDVMRDMRERGVPFSCAELLAAGAASDISVRRYASFEELNEYAYCVAGVVGQWLTRLFGEHDPWMLERAAMLGRAMQLTNIARDVGEDWDAGRLYLPAELLDAHGLCADDVGAMRSGVAPIDRRYRDAIDDLLLRAERDYRMAAEAVSLLPPGFRGAVAVAAAVYEGIHVSIRHHGHDNLGRRGVVSPVRKMTLAARALWTLERRGATTARHQGSRAAAGRA